MGPGKRTSSGPVVICTAQTGRTHLWTPPLVQGKFYRSSLGCHAVIYPVSLDLDGFRGVDPNHDALFDERCVRRAWPLLGTQPICHHNSITLAVLPRFCAALRQAARASLGSYLFPVVMTAHAMRALLLASATVATLNGRRRSRPANQTSLTAVDRRRQLTTERAPWIKSWRM